MTTRVESTVAFASGWPCASTPNSVSLPMIRRTVMPAPRRVRTVGDHPHALDRVRTAPGEPGPVLGVLGVGQVLLLVELLVHGHHQVLCGDPRRPVVSSVLTACFLARSTTLRITAPEA